MKSKRKRKLRKEKGGGRNFRERPRKREEKVWKEESGRKCQMKRRGGKANFFKSQHIANLLIVGLNLLSQNRIFLLCSSPHNTQITNSQIYISIVFQSTQYADHKFANLQNTAQLCLKTVLKVLFLKNIFFEIYNTK
jgi:hypothetical protein